MPQEIVDKQCAACGHPVVLVPVPEEVCPNCGTTKQQDHITVRCLELIEAGGFTARLDQDEVLVIYRPLAEWDEDTIYELLAGIEHEWERRVAAGLVIG